MGCLFHLICLFILSNYRTLHLSPSNIILLDLVHCFSLSNLFCIATLLSNVLAISSSFVSPTNVSTSPSMSSSKSLIKILNKARQRPETCGVKDPFSRSLQCIKLVFCSQLLIDLTWLQSVLAQRCILSSQRLYLPSVVSTLNAFCLHDTWKSSLAVLSGRTVESQRKHTDSPPRKGNSIQLTRQKFIPSFKGSKLSCGWDSGTFPQCLKADRESPRI